MNTIASRLAAAAFLILSALPSQAAPKYKITWLIGHPNLDYFEEAAATFAKTVKERSNGEIEVVVKPADNPWEDTGRSAPSAEIARKVAAGEAEMGHSFTDVMGSMDHRLWAFDLPFLFNDYNHLERVFEGPVGKEMLDGLQQHQIKGLAFTFSGGANVLSSPRRAIRTPEDLKGMRVGVFGAEIDQAWLKALGAKPVAVGHHEEGLGELAGKGALDAAVVTWRRQYRVPNLGLDYRYGSAEGVTYLVSVTYVNAKFFDSLPKKHQEMLASAVRDAARTEREKTIELNARSQRRMESKGVTSVVLSQAQRQAFQLALAPVYERTLEPLVGKDLVERLRRAGEDGPVSRLTSRTGRNPK